MRVRLSIRRLCLLGATAMLSVSVACHLDMLLKPSNTPRPSLTVAPTEVVDSARAGSREVRNVPVTISNSGAGTFTWSASDRSAWIRLDPQDGAVPGSFTISLDPQGMAPGVYEGEVTVITKDAADSQATAIPVTFKVQKPGLSVTPTSIEHATNANSGATFTETMQITNSGTGALNWTATKQRSWVTLSATSGTGDGTIQVTINSAGLAGGIYHDDIVVTSPGATGSPAHVSVTLTIFAPGLAVTPAAIHGSAPPGSTTPVSDTLHISNSGTGTITWTASKTQPWLTLSKASGGAPDAIAVTMDPTGLPPGIQRDTVVFTSAEATNGPVKVPVELEIVQPGLVVTPPSITATAQSTDQQTQDYNLSVSNSGGGTLAWFASADTTWITVTPAGGLAPSTLKVTIDPRGLGPGIHNGTVTVSSPGAVGSPFAVPVHLTITQKACTEIALTPDEINRPGTLDGTDCEAPHRPGSLANWYGLSANAGEGLSIRMMSSVFDAYLLLVDAAGNVLTQNDECPGETGTACIVNFPLATTGRYFIEATSKNPGASGPLTITVILERAPFAPQGLGQFHSDGINSIPVGFVTTENQVLFKGRVNDPNQTDQVRLEVELEPLGSTFTGVATHLGDFVAVSGGGAQTSVRATGLLNNQGYHWQVRSCDHTGRCSAWLSFGDNPETSADFTVAVPPGPSPPRQQ